MATAPPRFSHLRGALIAAGLVLARTQPPNCNPAGYSQRYPKIHFVPDNIALVSGYDESDPRYRFMPSEGVEERYWGYPPGGYATPVYTDTTGAGHTLYLGTEHIGHEDLQYQTCMNIGAVIHVHTELDLRPYIEESTRSLPNFYGQVFPGIPLLSVPEDKWYIGWSEIDAFLDRELASHSVMVYDDEGHKVAAAIALAYRIKKDGTAYSDAYNELLAAREWVNTLRDGCPQDVAWIQALEAGWTR